jgi:hypothetical protein
MFIFFGEIALPYVVRCCNTPSSWFFIGMTFSNFELKLHFKNFQQYLMTFSNFKFFILKQNIQLRLLTFSEKKCTTNKFKTYIFLKIDVAWLETLGTWCQVVETGIEYLVTIFDKTLI